MKKAISKGIMMDLTHKYTESEVGELACAVELDANGFLAGPGETESGLADRINGILDQRKELLEAVQEGNALDEAVGFRTGPVTGILPEIMKEAVGETQELFAFSADWVPAFFPSASLGALWGGCTVQSEEGLSVFFIRKEFKTRPKWFIYNRTELLAHEMCHAARGPIGDMDYEEHFAYMTSGSGLRRYMGNCFRHDYDAILFILPVFVLLGVQILNFVGVIDWPSWPFWILALCYPLFLLGRNAVSRGYCSRAELVLANCRDCTAPKAVLFRCTAEEICDIARMDAAAASEWVQAKAGTELRWKVIRERFFAKGEEDHGNAE